MYAGQEKMHGDENNREKMSLRSASITSQDKQSETASIEKQNGKTRKVKFGFEFIYPYLITYICIIYRLV